MSGSTSSLDSKNDAKKAGGHEDHGGAHEITDASFNKALWVIPLSMVVLVVFVYICWFGATKTLKTEITSKGGPGVAADSTPPSTATP
jgi:hypothetical protein